MRKIFLTLLLAISIPVCAKNTDSRVFPVNADTVFMSALSALNKLNLNIAEIQSKSGYILFSTPNGDEFLIMIGDSKGGNSRVKISKLNEKSALNEIQTVIFTEIQEIIKNKIETVKNE